MLADNCSKNGDLRFSPLNSCILQICTEDKWTDVCVKPGSNQWGKNVARVACYQMVMVWKEKLGIRCFIYKRNSHYTLYRIEYYSNLDMAST